MCYIINFKCSKSHSDGSVLKQSHQSKTGYKYMMWHIDEKCVKDWTQSSTSMEKVEDI